MVVHNNPCTCPRPQFHILLREQDYGCLPVFAILDDPHLHSQATDDGGVILPSSTLTLLLLLLLTAVTCTWYTPQEDHCKQGNSTCYLNELGYKVVFTLGAR